MLCTSRKGDEGAYSIEIYGNDEQMDSIDDAIFDRWIFCVLTYFNITKYKSSGINWL